MLYRLDAVSFSRLGLLFGLGFSFSSLFILGSRRRLLRHRPSWQEEREKGKILRPWSERGHASAHTYNIGGGGRGDESFRNEWSKGEASDEKGSERGIGGRKSCVCGGRTREKGGERRKTRGRKALSPCLEGVAGWFSRLKRERGWNKIGSLWQYTHTHSKRGGL